MLALTKALIPTLILTVGVALMPTPAMADDDDYENSYRIRQRALNDYFRNNSYYGPRPAYHHYSNYGRSYYPGHYRTSYRHNRRDRDRWHRGHWNRDYDNDREYENFSIYSTPYGGLGFSYSEGEWD